MMRPPWPAQTPSRCHYSRELKNRRVLALAMSLRDVQGAGSKGFDAFTTDQFSALDFESPFSPTSPDPDTTGGRDDGLQGPGHSRLPKCPHQWPAPLQPAPIHLERTKGSPEVLSLCDFRRG